MTTVTDDIFLLSLPRLPPVLPSLPHTHTHAHTLQFSSLQKNIDDRSMEKEKMKTELLAHQMCLERDILALKKEIQERDDTIQDKVRGLLLG